MKKYVCIILLISMGCKGVSQEKEAVTEKEEEQTEAFKVVKSEEEWRKELTDTAILCSQKSRH